MKTIAYTSAAVNYLPKVRKLCASIKRLHPEFEVVLALSDKPNAGVDFSAEPIDRVIAVEDLDIPDRTRWSFFHDIVELSTAIKPFVLKKLLAEDGVARVLYFDPDMVLFSRVDDILATLSTSNLALTPHQTKPESSLEAILDNAIRERRPKLRAALIEGREDLIAFKDIATLRDAGVKPPPDRATDWAGAAAAAREYGMNRLAERLEQSAG